MATITNSIGTAGGRDYSTITAWVAALPANLVTAGNSYVGECYNDSVFSDVSVSISGHTTGASNTITLTVAAGQSYVDNANKLTNALCYNASNGCAWSGSIGYGQLLTIGDNYVTVSRLQMRETSNNANFPWFNQGANNIYSQCIITATQRNNSSVVYFDGGKATNLLVICTAAGSIAGGGIRGNNGTRLANVTLVSPTGNNPTFAPVISGYGNNTVLINVAAFGFANAFSGTFSGSSSNTCTDLAAAPGSSNQLSKTYANQFVSNTSGAPDYRLKTGADCINNGATDTTDIPAANDIVGTARPQGAAWDIGCWELTVASTFRPRLIRWST